MPSSVSIIRSMCPGGIRKTYILLLLGTPTGNYLDSRYFLTLGQALLFPCLKDKKLFVGLFIPYPSSVISFFCTYKVLLKLTVFIIIWCESWDICVIFMYLICCYTYRLFKYIHTCMYCYLNLDVLRRIPSQVCR